MVQYEGVSTLGGQQCGLLISRPLLELKGAVCFKPQLNDNSRCFVQHVKTKRKGKRNPYTFLLNNKSKGSSAGILLLHGDVFLRTDAYRVDTR